MSPQITPLLLRSEFRATSGRRGLELMSVGSLTGDQATAGYTSSNHTYSMPVVREMPPRQAAFGHAW